MMKCPNCNSVCDRDSAHNGVAMLYGPWGCEECGWSEWEEYDRSKGPKTDDFGNPVDQYGIAYPWPRKDRS